MKWRNQRAVTTDDDNSNNEMWQICSDLVFPYYQSIWKVAIGCVQGANLLQIISMKGKTPFVAYMLEQGYEVLSLRFNSCFQI